MAKKRKTAKRVGKKGVVKKKAARRGTSSHVKSMPGFRAGALASALGAQATKAVTFTWTPSGKASWVKADQQKLAVSPTTLSLTLGHHGMQWLLTGAPKTPYSISVTGAKFPTGPISGVISDQGFDAGTSDVEV